MSAKTQKELLKKLHQSMEEYQGVDLSEESKMPLSQWLDRWLEEYAAPSVRPSTLEGYRGYINRNIKPYLGNKPVGKITADDVRKLYRELQRNGRQEYHPEHGHKLSGGTIRRIHGVFHEAMDAAVRENLIPRNPTEGITLPKKKTAPKQILNDAQLEKFMEVIREDSIWHDFFYTELTTGLRRGELCGLKPSRVAESGYRYYSRVEVDRLQEILYYRALGVGLAQIKECLDDPSFDRLAALKRHLVTLEAEQQRLEQLIQSVRDTIGAEERKETMSDEKKFEAFKKQVIEQNEKTYGSEVRAKYGDTQVDEANAAVMNLTLEQYQEWSNLSREIQERLEDAVQAGVAPECEEGKKIAALHRR